MLSSTYQKVVYIADVIFVETESFFHHSRLHEKIILEDKEDTFFGTLSLPLKIAPSKTAILLEPKLTK